jgi:hypothetical protein
MRTQLFRGFVVILLAASSCRSYSQIAPTPLPLHSAVQDKDFYLLSLLQGDSATHKVLSADAALKEISAERARSLALAMRTCKEVSCTLKALLWTDEEIGAVSLALEHLYRSDASLRTLMDARLRRSGAYAVYQKQAGAELMRNAWQICALGLNDVISVYGEGGVPRYPLIDSASVDLHSSDFNQSMEPVLLKISTGDSASNLFFEPSLVTALELLKLNHRDEAGRLEPMETGVNEAAVKTIPSIVWKKYSYSVIVVPGAGPNDPDTALSETGRRRTELAAKAYQAGEAPFILVSGGYVHPSQTRFSEAMEMKKALLNDYHVPEAAILVDPHARHTTTNMRNAAREIYRYGMPMSKAGMIVSDAAQTTYIAGQAFADRCTKELGYVPYKLGERLSDTSLVFFPMQESLEQDPMDPLDP